MTPNDITRIREIASKLEKYKNLELVKNFYQELNWFLNDRAFGTEPAPVTNEALPPISNFSDGELLAEIAKRMHCFMGPTA